MAIANEVHRETIIMPPSPEAVYHAQRRRSPIKRIKVGLRDTWLLLREFQGILIAFVLTMFVATWSFWSLWNLTPDAPSLRPIEALYFIVTMLFFEPTLDFPDAWYLDTYFFLMPLLGLIFLTLGVADFAILLFNRQARQDQWEASVASLMNNHVIVIGLGHVGIRVVRELVLLEQDIVIVQNSEIEDHFEEARSYEIPIIVGDGRSVETQEKAGVSRAAAVIICTCDDLANLQMASHIRQQRSDIRIVMRMFDDQFARTMAQGFNIDAVISSSGLAAPAFAGAATGTEIVQTFKVEEKVLAMGRIAVKEGSQLDGMTIGEVEEMVDVSVVLLHTVDGHIDIEPDSGYQLTGSDVIAIISEMKSIQQISARLNRVEGEGSQRSNSKLEKPNGEKKRLFLFRR
ncbi:MAG: potassium channel family protein [Anaerolineae bacterium]